MRVTSSVRAIVRSYEDSIKDMRNVIGIGRRYGLGNSRLQPIDCQPFSISSSQVPEYARLVVDKRYTDDVLKVRLNPRPYIDRHNNAPFRKLLSLALDKPRLMMHRRTYAKAQKIMASPDQIVYGSRFALKRILEAIRKKNLSPLSPLMLDDSILSEIAIKSKLSSLTNRQLSCLDVSDDDFIGMDGIVDRWNKTDLPEDDPSGLLSSLKIGKCEKLKKPILTYTVDMTAILRKKVLVSKMGSLPPPKDLILSPAPNGYGLPWRRLMYSTVEFVHVGTDAEGKFSDEPFIRNFHVHSY